jgi:hypothetical protein
MGVMILDITDKEVNGYEQWFFVSRWNKCIVIR